MSVGAHRVLLTREALRPGPLAEGLAGEEDGALVTFSGIVRRREGDLRLRAIDYQAYESMAARQIEMLLADARRRWGVFSAVVAHRTGEVPVGEASVWIGVAAAHRGPAFEVARFLIDELKARVPIWKRAHLPETEGPAGQG